MNWLDAETLPKRARRPFLPLPLSHLQGLISSEDRGMLRESRFRFALLVSAAGASLLISAQFAGAQVKLPSGASVETILESVWNLR